MPHQKSQPAIARKSWLPCERTLREREDHGEELNLAGHVLPNVQDEPRPWLARLVLLGARGVTAMVVGSGALLAEQRRRATARELNCALMVWKTGDILFFRGCSVRGTFHVRCRSLLFQDCRR